MIATLAESRTRIRAIVCERPGPIERLRVSEIPMPVVSDDGVLVRLRASSVNPVDLFSTSQIGFRMRKPRPLVLGTDFAGTVEEVGRNATQFRVGDEVFGGSEGVFAEVIAVGEASPIARKPKSISFAEAGSVAVAGTTALQALRDHGHLEPGQRVLINGASGGVGTFTVQIAKALGARVTAVCSTRNVEMVRSLGADDVIDYRRQDFTRGRDRFDLIVDIAGSHSLRRCVSVLEGSGTYVGVGAAGIQHARAGTLRAFGHFLNTRIASIGTRQKVVSLFIAQLKQQDMEFLAALMGAGRLKPVIERRHELSEVPAALAYLNEGHATAKIAIDIDTDNGGQ